jgi:Cys-tRNA(Pro)/Cys-tRNA(Cys) deacylase
MKAVKTNAARLLEAMGIDFELRSYEVDENDLSAETVAAKIGLPPEQVFKTLLVRGERTGPAFAVLAANAELDLKALARAMGDRKADLVPLREVESLTGYIRGGVTVLGAKRDFPVYADEWIELHEVIAVSAGVRGTQMLISPNGYLRAARATVASLSK